ncbi:glutathione peroxidase [Thalassobacillus devorans]|uniref:Glutathione peroxidase n=1 Tax=Thalassobacillus devorans TaxID=279813 RepID=A0ABQ1PNU2_9BACI|nr:glutathione peroxidase [Thalassobacillus devorans]NIK30442.1 glutathione peroxidase [Thalassobacillus devorans]GGD00243.1 glutathione peroxidase [Thalassobacillus devorans]
MSNVHGFSAVMITGDEKSLADFKGKVLLVVNTASKCGFTPQYEGLQELYDKYNEQGLEVLGFPSNQFMNQEPGTEQDIQEFCKVNYGVTFPMFSKVDVKGKDTHPLFQHLVKEAPGMVSDQVKWNFTKFLVDQNGNVVDRYAPQTKPEDIETDIQKLLN